MLKSYINNKDKEILNDIGKETYFVRRIMQLSK